MMKKLRVGALILAFTLAGSLTAMAAPPDWAGGKGQMTGQQAWLQQVAQQQDMDQDRERLRDGSCLDEDSICQQVYGTTGIKDRERDQERERLRDGSCRDDSVCQQVYKATGNKGLDVKLQVKARVHVRLHGQEVQWPVPPVIKEGRTLVPVRALCNGLGATVDWDPETSTITITKGDTVIKLALDSRVFTINGEVQELDVPAQLISNSTFVPLRFVSQALRQEVNYQQAADDGAEVDILPGPQQ